MLHTIAKPDLIFYVEKSFYVEGDQKWTLWHNQTREVQQHFIDQAAQLLAAIQENRATVEFSLPEKVILCDPLTNCYREERIPSRYHHQSLSRNLFQRNRSTLTNVLQRLSDLQNSSHLYLSLSANILRYWIARLWFNQLPQGESLPVNKRDSSDPAEQKGNCRQERLFPQWILFDEAGQPLFSQPEEAKSRICSMEETLQSLLSTMAIDPSIVEEEAFLACYTSLITQWIEQGRAYCVYLTKTIASVIRRRESESTLNRGLSIRLPYFDDQLLEIKYLEIEVVPGGRITFEEFFLTQAVQQTKKRITADIKLSPTTRQHILAELTCLESYFSDCAPYLPLGVMSPYFYWASVASPKPDSETASET